MMEQRTIHLEDRDRFAFGGAAAVRMAVQAAVATLPPPPEGYEWTGTLVDTSLRVNPAQRRHEAEVNFTLSELPVVLQHPLVIGISYRTQKTVYVNAKPRGSVLLPAVPLVRHVVRSVFDGEPFTVIAPDPMPPIDTSKPVNWVNYASTYDPRKQ